MKIFQFLFGRKKKSVATAVQAPVPFASPVSYYYQDLLRAVRRTESPDFLLQHAAHSSGYVREAVLQRVAELALPELLAARPQRLQALNSVLSQEAG